MLACSFLNRGVHASSSVSGAEYYFKTLAISRATSGTSLVSPFAIGGLKLSLRMLLCSYPNVVLFEKPDSDFLSMRNNFLK